MIPFAVVMFDEFRHGSPEMPLADRNQPIEAFFFDRSHEPFGVRVRIGRARGSEDDADPRFPESTPHVAAPVPFHISADPVGCENLVTPPRRIREPHHRDGRDGEHDVRLLPTRPMHDVALDSWDPDRQRVQGPEHRRKPNEMGTDDLPAPLRAYDASSGRKPIPHVQASHQSEPAV